MKNLLACLSCVITVFFISCSGGGQKKVTVYSSGTIKVTDKTIELEPGTRHNEQELIFTDEKVTLTVKTAGGGDKTFDATENGVYLLNLQVDTLIGSLVNYGASAERSRITAEQVEKIIDSTQQLMLGKNASPANKTFFIPPFTLQKISAENNARLVSSFKGIPYKVEADADGKIPEVYKFFTNKQKRETLTELFQKREEMKKTGVQVIEE